MKQQIADNIIQVVILDISGVYVQIHNQGYFESTTVEEIQKQYADTKHWRIIII